MRLERVLFNKIGPIAGRVEIDFTRYPGPLVAVVAANGTGKSFCLETAVLGACYRDTASQGAPLKRALARDSFFESTLVNGKRMTIRHLLDPFAGRSGKGEALVLGEDGALLPEFRDSVSVSNFDTWAAKYLPLEEVVRMTTFAVQKSEGFVGATSAQRIQAVLEVTGASRIERARQHARKERDEAAANLKATLQRIADAKQGVPDVAAVEGELADLRASAERTREAEVAARAALATAETDALRVAELDRERRMAVEIRERIERDIGEARRRLADLERRQAAADPQAARDASAEREHAAAAATGEARARLLLELDAARALVTKTEELLANGRAFTSQAEAIRAAVSRVETLRAELAREEAEQVAVGPEAERVKSLLADSSQRLQAIELRIERATEVLGARAAVDAAVAALPAAEADLAEADHGLVAATAEVERLQGEHIAGADERNLVLRGGLVRGLDLLGASQHEPAARRMEEALALDDTALAAAERVPVELVAARAAVAEAAAARRAVARRAEDLRALAGRAAALQAAAEDLTAVEGEKASLEAQRAAWTEQGAGAAERAAATARRAEELRAELVDVGALAGKLENLIKAEAARDQRSGELTLAVENVGKLLREVQAMGQPVAAPALPDVAGASAAVEAAEAAARAAAAAVGAAEATRRELEPQVSEVGAKVAALLAEQAAAPPVLDVPPLPFVPGKRHALEAAETTARAAAANVARAEQRLEQATAAAARAAELDRERATIEADLADWARLEIDFGRDGIQSALVDSSGPELTELVNDLLRCHGTRYSATITTKRAKSDGQGETDECRVMVIDTVAGTEKEAREHSGGERTFLGEAMSLALTMLACRRAGVTDCTLVRDESGAALDAVNARAYVAMLRRAAEVIGARQVLVVSHDPAVQSLCDSQINLKELLSCT